MLSKSFIFLSEKFIKLFSNFFIVVWIMKLLGPTEYGEFSIAFTLIIFFFSFSSFGLDSLIIRDINCLKNKKGKIIFTFFCLKVIASLFISISFLIYFQFFNSNVKFFQIITILCISQIVNSLQCIDLYYIAIKKSNLIVLIGIITTIFSSIFKYLIIKSFANSIALSFSYLIETFIYSSIILTSFKLHLFSNKITLGFSFRYARLILSKAKYLILGHIYSLVISKGEIFVLGIFFGTTSIGIYSGAQKLIQPLHTISHSILTISFPNLIKKIGSVNTKYFRKISVYILLITIFISSSIFLCRDILVEFLLGNEYKESASIISVLIWSLILVSLYHVRKKYLITINNSFIYRYYAISGSLITFFLLLIFTYFYGMIGTAIGFTASMFISLFILPLFLNTKPWYYLK